MKKYVKASTKDMKYWRLDYYRQHNWIDTKYIKDESSQGAINKARVKNIVDLQEVTEEEYLAGLARIKAAEQLSSTPAWEGEGTMIYEYDKKHLREQYKGNKAAMRNAGDCTIWTPERIEKCFAFGHGTEKDLREYMSNNRRYCIFEDR